ncbi:MAG: YqeG family HAD IIIA-type phosphatase [Clostridiales bacterium]|nr:YqeG family HAD IIIA-type phosphatase [Clostridiales bacterium]
MLFEQLYPRKMIASVYELDWEALSGKYKGVIFDIDNTLVPHGAPADEQAVRLFGRLHGLDMKTMLVSNNGEARVKPFADRLQTGYIYKAGKPKKEGYEAAMRKMGTDADSTLFIGDQIFTDVWGANRAGIYTMLTTPIDPSTDEIQIVIKRWFERPFRRERRKRCR